MKPSDHTPKKFTEDETETNKRLLHGRINEDCGKNSFTLRQEKVIELTSSILPSQFAGKFQAQTAIAMEGRHGSVAAFNTKIVELSVSLYALVEAQQHYISADVFLLQLDGSQMQQRGL